MPDVRCHAPLSVKIRPCYKATLHVLASLWRGKDRGSCFFFPHSIFFFYVNCFGLLWQLSVRCLAKRGESLPSTEWLCSVSAPSWHTECSVCKICIHILSIQKLSLGLRVPKLAARQQGGQNHPLMIYLQPVQRLQHLSSFTFVLLACS